MYEAFYGLRNNPFQITPNTEFYFPTENHDEAVARLAYGITQKKGFLVITGEIGSGKTLVCRLALKKLPQSFEPVMILSSRLTPRQLIEAILTDMGVDCSRMRTKSSMIKKIYSQCVEAASNGRTFVIMIDEAQNLPIETLEELRMLSNFETEDAKLLQIVLIGQPELKDIIKDKRLKQFAERVYMYYHIPNLTLEDAIKYVQHRIRLAQGNPDSILPVDAIKIIAAAAHNNPRKINIFCDNALLSGVAKNEKPVSVFTVRDTLKEFGIDLNVEEMLWEGFQTL